MTQGSEASSSEQPAGETRDLRLEAAIASEAAWLGEILGRREDPRSPGNMAPGWMLEDDETSDNLATLAPRSEAFLNAGGTLSYEQLNSLAQYLGIVVNSRAMAAEHGQDVTTGHDDPSNPTRALLQRVRELRDAQRPDTTS